MFKKPEYVYAIYKEKSFTKAAERLYISQPSLSAAIKNIEDEIGAPLFDRCGGEVTPTEIGKEYVKAAESIMNIKNEFIDRLNDIYELNVGSITVGAPNYLSCNILPHIINRFSSRYPNIELTLMEAKSTTLEKMIYDEDVDIVLDSFDQTMQSHIGYPLAKEKILLCVPSSFEINDGLKEYAVLPNSIYDGDPNALNKEPVPIEAFCNEKFILLKNGNDMYSRAMSIFEKAGIMPDVSFYVDQLNISYSLAESGMGICFAPDTSFRFGRFGDNVTLYNIADAPSTRMLYVAHKKNKYCTSAMRKFIEIAKEVIQK